MSDSNPREDLDAEGIPDLEDHPPGIDVETDEESPMAPRDHPVAAGADPAYAVTDAEQSRPESVASRSSRELPDVDGTRSGLPPTGGAGTRTDLPSAEVDGVPEEVDGMLQAEDDGDVARDGHFGQLLEPDPEVGADGMSLAEAAGEPESAQSPEEAAVTVVDDERIR